ncbi:MAG: protein-signal peptide and transmembrane prediction, partial [Planctomycetaceae bacterium]
MSAALALLLLTCLSVLPVPAPAQSTAALQLPARSRHLVAPDSSLWHSTQQTLTWLPAETCVVVCDMWDDHWCKPSAARVAEMAPVMNEVLKAARSQGLLIIHCPSDTLDFYKDTPQRQLAMAAPKIDTKPPLERWIRLIPEREGQLPIDDSDGGCDCDPPVVSRRAWSRQHPAIDIHPQ